MLRQEDVRVPNQIILVMENQKKKKNQTVSFCKGRKAFPTIASEQLWINWDGMGSSLALENPKQSHR